MQFFPVFSRVLASCTFRHDPQTRYAVSQSSDFVVEICPIPLLNHVVRCLLDRLASVAIVIVIFFVIGRGFALSAAGLGYSGRLGRGGVVAVFFIARARIRARLALGRVVLEVSRHRNVLEPFLLSRGKRLDCRIRLEAAARHEVDRLSLECDGAKIRRRKGRNSRPARGLLLSQCPLREWLAVELSALGRLPLLLGKLGCRIESIERIRTFVSVVRRGLVEGRPIGVCCEYRIGAGRAVVSTVWIGVVGIVGRIIGTEEVGE